MVTHMLIATDGTQLAQKAVDEGLALAASTGARVTALTVTEGWSVLDATHRSRAGAENPIHDYERTMQQRAKQVLGPVAEKASSLGVRCETVHRPESTPAEAIVEEAEKRNCDMIVMASHGRRGLDRIMLGSQTLRVLALTNRAVLVYR
jgi:nucleotide-binding universal stress UspA family protein